MKQENVMERKDSWSPSDDLLLAQTVLEHIRTGSTQLAAFEDISERLGRTSAACGFRWNATVRKRYEDAIKKAKMDRLRNRDKVVVSAVPESPVGNSEMFEPIPINQIIETIKNLQQAVAERDNRIVELEHENENLKKNEPATTEDYQTLLKIIEMARILGALPS